jgi:FemAB-related protein (PEP-CTERM system-associated)
MICTPSAQQDSRTPVVSSPARACRIRTLDGRDLERHLPHLESYVARAAHAPLSRHPAWPLVLERGLRHIPFCLEAVEGETIRGLLPLACVHSLLFGRFLVSLPYLDYGGVMADNDPIKTMLIDRAVELAEQLDVRHLELRHEQVADHPALADRMSEKVHMRLALPTTGEELWSRLSAKVRNQVRKGRENGLAVAWGGAELLPEFYDVFSHNMRDLGTPVYGKRLFRCILRQFPGRAELCVVRAGNRALAAALILHGWGISEVTSASSLRRYNSTNCNMLMYWNLLERSIRRGQATFDFGRSSRDSNTFRFKKQWGAVPGPAEWQYHVRKGSMTKMRPDHPRYRHLISLWRQLPVALTRLIGPSVVRGIP